MSKAIVVFSFEGIFIQIQCITEDKMKDICQKFANKIKKSINSYVFLYGGNQLNFQLCFKDLANSIDKERNEMKILVIPYEKDELSCPNCGEKINLNIDKINDIKSSIHNINDTIKGAKLMIDNIIKISSVDAINVQLKNVNLIFNNLNEDIKKLSVKFNNLFDIENINKENKEKSNFNNYIIAEINVKDEDINKDIKIIDSYEEYFRLNPGKFKPNNT